MPPEVAFVLFEWLCMQGFSTLTYYFFLSLQYFLEPRLGA